MKTSVVNSVVALLVLLGSVLLGLILSLSIGLSYEGLFWISPEITVIHSLALGFAVLASLYFTRMFVGKTNNLLWVLILSFSMVLGAGIISSIAFFLSSPASFLYSNNRTITFILISLLFFITIAIIVSGFVYFQATVLQKEKALAEERLLKKQMELKFLTSKINPHFLFNSLNLLISLLKNPRQAEETLIHLSELLRYQVDISEAATVSLESELKAVENYLSIQKQRFGEKLSYQIDCTATGEIPPLVIQPLVENSIKHNIDHTEQLHISIQVKVEDRRLIIRIIDSNAALNDRMLTMGVGLNVTKTRVEHFGGAFLIDNGGITLDFDHD